MEPGIIAEATNSFMGEFIYAGIALLTGIAAGVALMARFRRPDPTQLEQPIATTINGPVQTQSLDKFATRDFCDMKHRAIENRVERVERDVGSLQSQVAGLNGGFADLVREEVGKVHARVNELDKSVGGLNTATHIQNTELTEIKRDIKILIGRKS